MKSVREQFLRSLRSGLSVTELDDFADEREGRSGAGKRTPPRAPVWQRRISEWAWRPENRRTLLLTAWVVAVLVMLLVTASVTVASGLILKTYKTGLVVSAVLWAVFFGVLILFLLPSKVVTTTFGGLLGISASELSSGASLISAADRTILNTSEQVRRITGGDGSFLHILLWIFVAILTLICLPAFFRE